MDIKKMVKSLFGILKCSLAHVHYSKGIYIGKGVEIKNGRNLKLGTQVQIRPYTQIYATDITIEDGCDIGERNRIAGNVHIEKNVLFGPDNHISSETHNYETIDIPVLLQGSSDVHKNGHEELRIGEGSWIGTHVAIIGDVHIGKHCVIGANSVVTADIPDFCVVGGVPAKILKQYDKLKKAWAIGPINKETLSQKS